MSLLVHEESEEGENFLEDQVSDQQLSEHGQ